MRHMDSRDAALKYLAHRNRTTLEMRTHLLEKGYERVETEETIRNLLELKYLDDYNYAREFMRYGVSKGRGILRIKNELIQRGVTIDTIEMAKGDEEAMGEVLGISEFERAMEQAEKTVGEQEITEKIIGKLGRRLSMLGYSMDVVYKVIGTFMTRSRGADDD